jgi:glycosyltransferase involved in cell wall biosynthesis
MHLVAAALAVLTLLLLVLLTIELLKAAGVIRRLGDISTVGDSWPRVSIVIAARNEERNIEEALQSVLSLDYPNLEIVFVNDRSTDRTAQIVERISNRDPRLHLETITTLPDGWLGKNYALHVGAGRADGELILFTDADIVFEPTALRRAVVYMREEALDHLTAGAEVSGPTLPLRMFIGAFAFFFVLYARPWRARNPRSSDHVGIGAFNLVRATAYRSAGGHQPIAMRPDDDMKLGKLLKMSGARQAFIGAVGFIKVEWYSSITEVIKGLEKNSFSAVDYRLGLLIVGTLTMFAFYIWPFMALFLTYGWILACNVAIVSILLILVGALCAQSGGKAWYGIAFPFATLLFIYILWRSSLMTLSAGGIRWRDTFYPLAALRANRI